MYWSIFCNVVMSRNNGRNRPEKSNVCMLFVTRNRRYKSFWKERFELKEHEALSPFFTRQHSTITFTTRRRRPSRARTVSMRKKHTRAPKARRERYAGATHYNNIQRSDDASAWAGQQAALKRDRATSRHFDQNNAAVAIRRCSCGLAYNRKQSLVVVVVLNSHWQ